MSTDNTQEIKEPKLKLGSVSSEASSCVEINESVKKSSNSKCCSIFSCFRVSSKPS